MKLFRALCIGVLLLSASAFTYGQSAAEAILVDEYDSRPCDDFLARLDAYLSEMWAHPHEEGFVVIANPPERRHGSVMLKRMMEAWFKFRGFDGSRIQIIRVDGESFRRSFWRIPPGGSPPKIEGSVLAFQISETIQTPFMLASETAMGEQICPPVDDQQIYAEFLKGNPSARGNVVVRERTKAKAQQKANAIVRKLNRKYGISAARLRTFPVVAHFPALHNEVIVEYWYLP